MRKGREEMFGLFAKRMLICLLAALMLAVFSMVIVACGEEEDGDGVEPGPEEKGTVEIGWIPWDEDVAVTYLWKNILEGQGYEVELTQLDVAPVYAGLAEGDLDLFFDSWLPVTHEDYWEEYGDQIDDIKIWYDQGSLELTVPAYLEEFNSIGDLQGQAEMFGGEIVGIEPGAGLTRLTREDVMPGYGLDGYTLLEGSTPTMLAELDRAYSSEEPIVVTLWHPHWAYAAYDLKDLEDPENLYGGAEELHVLARDGFVDEHPELVEWLENFEMTDAQLASLEKLVIEDYGSGLEEEAVEEWLSESANQNLVDSWLGE
ncbi:MAG: glycine betaine ABC transporter substrate-binding protein [Actinomycetota bacterium]